MGRTKRDLERIRNTKPSTDVSDFLERDADEENNEEKLKNFHSSLFMPGASGGFLTHSQCGNSGNRNEGPHKRLKTGGKKEETKEGRDGQGEDNKKRK